jgi:hypothetical protein
MFIESPLPNDDPCQVCFHLNQQFWKRLNKGQKVNNNLTVQKFNRKIVEN